MRTMALALMASAAVSIGLIGCGDDDDGGGAAAAGTVDATLSDFEIGLSDTSAPAGEVIFRVTNDGPSTHEFVVFKTDQPADALPTDENGDVAEGDDFAPVDEIEDIAPGATPTLAMDLDAGRYVVICNVPGHYRQGMHTSFTVT
jgi:uncharacterized cupredoxin-like copper-binding protein